MSRINDIRISKNFKLYEFECKDGNHQVVIHPKLLELAQNLRDRIGKPIIINSAYRTPEYNRKIGGSPTSQHLYGKAIDVRAVPGLTIDELAAHGRAVGFAGIGKYTWGCHFDVREDRAEWDYR